MESRKAVQRDRLAGTDMPQGFVAAFAKEHCGMHPMARFLAETYGICDKAGVDKEKSEEHKHS